jgi:hypothetical protein
VRFLTATALCMLALSVSAEGALSAPEPGPAPAASTLARCVQTTNRLSVLVLMDESGSLGGKGGTDPQNQRVEGLRAALAGLAHLASGPAGGQAPAVDVLLLGFYGKVSPPPDKARWLAVTENSLASLDARAGEYANQNYGRDTDYGTALLAARQLLAQHAAEQTRTGGPAPCKALIWFTDGRYDITDRIGATGLPTTVPYAPNIKLDQPGAGKRATLAGKTFLCRPGGLMDGLASDGVIKFTVGLSVQMSAEDSAFLNSATTGLGAGFRCGSQLSPKTGAYLSVANARNLFFAFGSMLEGSNVPITSTATCPVKPCERGSSAFRTVPGLHRFRIQASTGANGIEIVLRSPTGAAIHLGYGASGQVSALGGTTVSARWLSPQTVEIEGDFLTSSSAWVGPWSFSFVAPQGGDTAAVPLSTTQLYADATPVLVGRDAVIRGGSSPLTLAIRQRHGQQKATDPLVTSVLPTVVTTDPVTGRSATVPVTAEAERGVYGAAVAVPTESEAPYLQLSVDLRFPAIDGVPVAPVEGTFRLPVRLPAHEGFPTVAPLELQLPSVTGKSKTAGFLTVTASPDASGCVWLAAPTARAPREAGEVLVTSAPAAASASGCIHLANGQSRRITVTLAPTNAATGSARVTLPVVLISSITAGSRRTAIQATFEMLPAPNVAKRIWLTAVLTLSGILIPLLLLHLLNYAGARFTEPQRLQTLIQDVEIDPEEGLRAADGGAVKERLADFTMLEHDRGLHAARSLSVGGFQLRTVASGSLRDRVFSLLRGPYGVAESNGAPLLAGAGRPLRVWRNGTAHEVPLALRGAWLFLPTYVPALSPDGSVDDALGGRCVKGRLLLLIADNESHERAAQLVLRAGGALQTHAWDTLGPAPLRAGRMRALRERFGSHQAPEDEFPTMPDEEGAASQSRAPHDRSSTGKSAGSHDYDD